MKNTDLKYAKRGAVRTRRVRTPVMWRMCAGAKPEGWEQLVLERNPQYVDPSVFFGKILTKKNYFEFFFGKIGANRRNFFGIFLVLF